MAAAATGSGYRPGGDGGVVSRPPACEWRKKPQRPYQLLASQYDHPHNMPGWYTVRAGRPGCPLYCHKQKAGDAPPSWRHISSSWHPRVNAASPPWTEAEGATFPSHCTRTLASTSTRGRPCWPAATRGKIGRQGRAEAVGHLSLWPPYCPILQQCSTVVNRCSTSLCTFGHPQHGPGCPAAPGAATEALSGDQLKRWPPLLSPPQPCAQRAGTPAPPQPIHAGSYTT